MLLKQNIIPYHQLSLLNVLLLLYWSNSNELIFEKYFRTTTARPIFIITSLNNRSTLLTKTKYLNTCFRRNITTDSNQYSYNICLFCFSMFWNKIHFTDFRLNFFSYMIFCFLLKFVYLDYFQEFCLSEFISLYLLFPRCLRSIGRFV